MLTFYDNLNYELINFRERKRERKTNKPRKVSINIFSFTIWNNSYSQHLLLFHLTIYDLENKAIRQSMLYEINKLLCTSIVS